MMKLVYIIITKNKIEGKEFQSLVLDQIKELAKRASPDFSFDQLRLKIGVTPIKSKDDNNYY